MREDGEAGEWRGGPRSCCRVRLKATREQSAGSRQYNATRDRRLTMNSSVSNDDAKYRGAIYRAFGTGRARDALLAQGLIRPADQLAAIALVLFERLGTLPPTTAAA